MRIQTTKDSLCCCVFLSKLKGRSILDNVTNELMTTSERHTLAALPPAMGNHYIHAATSENTRTAYQNDINHFVNSGGLLPSTPDAIIRYLQAFAEKLNPRTLVRRLTAIKHWHVYQGFSDPTAYPLVRKTLTGIMHVHGKPKRKALALTSEQLITMAQYLSQQNTLTSTRNNALLQIGFFGAFRVSELTQIKVEHITFVPEGIEILIPRSKTDQNGEGQHCAIPYGDPLLCPASAIKAWCERANIQSSFIFREVDRHQNIGQTPLSSKSVGMILKAVAKSAGLPKAEEYSSHSLRRGFATTASRKGAPFVAIMRHGRWRHEGTVLGYIEEGQRFETNAAQMIFQRDTEKTEL
jgi:site-specific recombinase XerD